MLLVSTVDGLPGRRLRVKAPETVYRLANGLLRVVGILKGEVCDIDTAEQRVAKRHPLRDGLSAYRHGDQLFLLRSEFGASTCELEVLDLDRLTLVAEFELPWPRNNGIALLPEHNAAGLAMFDVDGEDTLYAVRW